MFLEFISKSSNLRELRFTDCPAVSKEFIKQASDLKTQRGDNYVLTIIFDGDNYETDYHNLKNAPLVIAYKK